MLVKKLTVVWEQKQAEAEEESPGGFGKSYWLWRIERRYDFLRG